MSKQKRRQRLKDRVSRCACGGSPEMIQVRGGWLKKNFIECPVCHWRSLRSPVMWMAVRSWNRDMEMLTGGK